MARRAREKIKAKDFAGAAEILLDRIRRGEGGALEHELLGSSLAELGRDDEAAHYLDRAIALYAAEGKEAAGGALETTLRRLDPLAPRRESFLRLLSDTLCDTAGELIDQGQIPRAQDLLARVEPVAGRSSSKKDTERVAALSARARAAIEQVRLDSASSSKAPGAEWPLFEMESAHYKLACNLEPDVVKRVADVMDDIHGYYVQIYFDGDDRKVRHQKATLRIHPTKSKMLEHWEGGGTGPEGWWSPGTGEVVTFDTRTSYGSLDPMLLTLFHEASHQFMTVLAGGASTPAWLNEGTASFFEGAVAMADHRVLWPDAAIGRLQSLAAQLGGGKPPTPADVVSYAQPGSYPAEYYSYGWGLVYFLQQYEDPKTLEYVYRPLYAAYRGEIIQKGGDPMKLFETVMLGKGSPLGHKTFAEFEADWRKWILETVRPLHSANARARELRLAAAKRYVEAADAARGGSRAKVGEEELLGRALAHLEYVRTRIDGDDHPDGELHLRQADLLERLKRPAAAAPLIERALDLADEKRFAVDEGRYDELEKRLARLDKKNAVLRAAASRLRSLTRSARDLLESYRGAEKPLVLRAQSFAAIAGAALKDEEKLLPAAEELRAEARKRGLLSGPIHSFAASAGAWKTVFSRPPERFETGAGRVALSSVAPIGYIDTSCALRGEYEVRAHVRREGALELGSAFGIVVAGHPGGDWVLAGIDDHGQAAVWKVHVPPSGSATTQRGASLFLDKPVAEDEAPLLAAHVFPDGHLELRVGDRAPVSFPLGLEPSVERFVGAFVKNGAATFEDAVVEIFP